MKILIFNGILSFQIVMSFLTLLSDISAAYMDRTENFPFWCIPRLILSVLFSLICATLATRLYRWLRLLSNKHLWKDILRGTVLKTEATEVYFFLSD
jgi:hypothetical protein